MSSAEPPVPSPVGRPAALLAVRLSPADAGRRVTVRHRLPAGDDRLTDVVGRLVSWEGGWSGSLLVERRDGSHASVPATDVVAAKVVPPEVSAEGMQAVAERGWPPFETATLGDWVLRWSDGVTGRGCSVRVCGSPGVPLPDALARVRDWYAERGGPALLQLPTPSAYDADLEAAGWQVARRTVLRTGTTADLLARAEAAGTTADAALTRSPRPSGEMIALVEPGLDPALVARVLTGPEEVVHVEARDPAGALLGTGRASATTAGGVRWAGVTSVGTVAAARRRGVASTVMAELARWALERGCARIYLQALAGNAPAARLYDGLGVPVHHAYVYRSPTPEAVSPL